MPEATAPLDVRVLNLARGVAGAYAMRLLADLGAQCSWWRWCEPRPGDWPPSDLFRAAFEQGLELHDARLDREALLAALPRLAPAFDLVITDFALPELEQDALFALLQPANPAIVVANADHFGRSGPYARWAGDELTDYALGGYWSIAGHPEREPLRVPGHQAQFHAGLQIAFAALAALRHARRTGRGQEIEVSAAEAMLGAHWSTTLAWTHEGRVFLRSGSDLVRAQDGWVHFFSLLIHQNVLLLLDRPDLAAAEAYQTITGRREHLDEIAAIARDWCARRPVMEIIEKAQSLRVPATPMADAPWLLADAHLADRGYFREVAGKAMPGRPYRWTDPWPEREAPRTLARALAGEASPRPAREQRPDAAPFAGLRVIEVTNNWAGPIACRHLADLGAEVIKVELATRPATRGSHYPGLDPGKNHWNRSGYFNQMNRNKRDIALNLATEDGRRLFLDLAARADVVIENNSARVMPNLGLGWERLREVNPRLVMVSISGFGATGARRDWIAYGSNIEAASGLASTTGYPDDERPYRTGSFIADPIAGAHAAIAAVAGLERLERTGRGSHVDIALTESAMTFMAAAFAHLHEHGEAMPRRGNAEPADAPTGAYPVDGRDDWIAIAVRTDAQWRALCDLARLNDPADGEDLAALDAAGRLAAREAIDERIAAWTRPLTRFEAVAALQERGVPAASILHNWQLHADPHFHVRGAFIHIEHPDTGVYPYPGFMWRFSATPPAVRSAAPRFAEGNAYVFGELLGLDAAAIARLEAEGVTAREPSVPVPPFVPAPLTTP